MPIQPDNKKSPSLFSFPLPSHSMSFERQPELVHEVLRVHDPTGQQEGVHLLLEELVSLDEAAEVCGKRCLS